MAKVALENGLYLRPMCEQDLSGALLKTQKVGWPHQLHDWQLHFVLGNGSVITNDEGTVLGTILWWDYGQQFATLGLVVVDTECQGQGLGRLLMNHVMTQAGNRTLQLVATVAGQRLYQQCGFHAVGKIRQLQGQPRKTKIAMPNDHTLRPLTKDDTGAILRYDQDIFYGNRHQLLKRLCGSAQGWLIERDTKICGYGFIRNSGRGQTVGPLVADSEEDALTLAQGLMFNCNGFVRFDITDKGHALTHWLMSIGLQQVDEVIHMQKGECQRSAAQYCIYALTSQAFG